MYMCPTPVLLYMPGCNMPGHFLFIKGTTHHPHEKEEEEEKKGINADKLRKKRDVIVCVLHFLFLFSFLLCVMLKGKCSFFSDGICLR